MTWTETHKNFDVVTREEFLRWMHIGLVDNNEGYGRPVYNGNVDYSKVINCNDIETVPADCTHVAWIAKKQKESEQQGQLPTKDSKNFFVKLMKIEGSGGQRFFDVLGKTGKFYVYNFKTLCFSPQDSLDMLLMHHNKVTMDKNKVVVRTKLNNTFTFTKI